MAFAPPADRKRYVPSGRLNWASFIQGSLMGVVGALFISAGMMLLQWIGFYLLVIVPLFAGLLAGVLAVAILRQAHCRNRLLATLLGFSLGSIAFFGHYHLDMLRHIGWDHWHRIDVTPRFFMLRMQVDTIGKVGHARPEPSPVMNWMMSGFELLLMGGIAAAFARSQASQPYAEGVRTWMTSQSCFGPLGMSLGVITALRDRSTAALEAAVQPMETDEPGYCKAEFWMCPLARDPERQEPMFLSMSELGPADSKGNRKTELVIDRWEIKAAEVVAFARKLPGLTNWLRGGAETPPAPEAAQQPASSVLETGVPSA